MNWKLVIVGGLVFWVVTNIVGFGTGAVIHERILKPAYQANSSFWLPALNQDPPDMAAVMPYWLVTSLIGSLIYAGFYAKVIACYTGPGWKRGFVFAFCLIWVYWAFLLAYSGLFNLPSQIWIWWGVDGLILFLIGGAAMGWAGGKFAGA